MTACDESGLALLMQELANEVTRGGGQAASKPQGAWVLFEGPLGAGKSTASRFLISSLGVTIAPEGSPTFSIAHEYETSVSIIHLDLYRLESEADLESAGVLAYFWERPGAIVLCEWASLFPALQTALLEDLSRPLWKVSIQEAGNEAGSELRSVQIFKRAS